jgi:RNase P subunit RPR2
VSNIGQLFTRVASTKSAENINKKFVISEWRCAMENKCKVCGTTSSLGRNATVEMLDGTKIIVFVCFDCMQKYRAEKLYMEILKKILH